MAEPFNPTDAVDFDEPLNDDPMYRATHIFSTADITATFDGQTQGDAGATFVDFSGANGTKETKEGVTLYPVDSEFGFNVSDFLGAEQKTIDGLYTEGWVGDYMIAGEQAGLVVSDAPTDTFKTPALLGTWLAGLGGNTVKASTEHYSTMQHVLSDQKYPGDPDALYPLDDDLILLSQTAEYDGQKVSELLAGTATFEGAVVTVEDVNQDGVIDLKDLLNPNESTVSYDIAYSSDYSVTMKDDGKFLYRWGNTVKRPNDMRIEAELPLPDEWNQIDTDSGLKDLFRVTSAELLVHHTITNNPNDQIRPEDFENESAIGTLPTYQEIQNYDGDIGRTVWVSTDDYYAGDGTLYETGTILRDSAYADLAKDSIMFDIGSQSKDLEMGFTNEWYTTMDREPFEPVLNMDGTDYETGPRWRLQPDKYGQDLPSVVIPLDPSKQPPVQKGDEKYEVGAETQTVINMLDWETPISPLEISAGWQNNAGEVSVNGLNMTNNLDVAFYIKGDIKPAAIYSTEVLLDYEAIDIFADGSVISGSAGSDYLVGVGNNTFTGGAGEDLFVLSYGTSATDVVTTSTVNDFEVGVDKLGLIGFDALAGFDYDLLESRELITQGVSGNDLTVSVDGELVATLLGLAADLGVGAAVDPGEGLDLLESFLITNPDAGTVTPPVGSGVWSVSGDTSVTEGDAASYTVSLNGTLLAGETAIIDVSIADTSTTSGDYASFVDAVNAAIGARADLAFDGTTLTYTGDGTPMADLVISLGTVDDSEDEGTETFSVALSNPAGTGDISLSPTGDDVITAIEDNDGEPPIDYNEIIGTSAGELLTGTAGADIIFGLGGSDHIYAQAGGDILVGGAGNDYLLGGADADQFVLSAGGGQDNVFDFIDGVDFVRLEGIDFADVTISSYLGLGTLIQAADSSMILRRVDEIDITVDDFVFDDGMMMI